MNAVTYARRNLFRRKGRTILTVLAIAMTVLIFSAIRTAVVSWTASADEAVADRLTTRHKVSIAMQLPRRYVDDLRDPAKIKGVKASTWMVWFSGKDPRARTPFFAAYATDHTTWFDVMDEMKADPAVIEAWKQTANGAILGDVLAKTLEVKVGDDLTITSDLYPGDWKFKVIGLYTPTRGTADRNSMVFRWDYLNNDPRAAVTRDQVGWIMSRIEDPSTSAETSRAIDKMFDERDDQTITMSDRAFQLSFLGAFSAVLSAFEIVSYVILVIMTLILANTIAMSVRERAHEYGVLRAIGFSPRYILGFIVGESTLLAVVGGLVGVGLTTLLINGAMGPSIEENMGGVFRFFRTPPVVLSAALALAVTGGLVAGLVPAITASRRKVVDALRRVD